MIALLLFSVFSSTALAYPDFQLEGARNEPIPLANRIGFDQRPGAVLPGNLRFTSDEGRAVTLSELYHAKPVLLALVYYGCPNLCNLAMNGLFKAMESLSSTAGRDYTVVIVSIDPTETSTLAAAKKRAQLRAYGRAALHPENGVHFLVGDQASLGALAEAVGFRYIYDAEHHQYAHPSGLMVLTPEGRIARYLFGIEYAGPSLRLALAEAAGRRIASPVDQFLLYCYHYDPAAGTYSFLVRRVLSVAAAGTALVLALGIGLLLRGERKRPGAA
jgi:protein SCO1/2